MKIKILVIMLIFTSAIVFAEDYFERDPEIIESPNVYLLEAALEAKMGVGFAEMDQTPVILDSPVPLIISLTIGPTNIGYYLPIGDTKHTPILEALYNPTLIDIIPHSLFLKGSIGPTFTIIPEELETEKTGLTFSGFSIGLDLRGSFVNMFGPPKWTIGIKYLVDLNDSLIVYQSDYVNESMIENIFIINFGLRFGNKTTYRTDLFNNSETAKIIGGK